MLQQQWYKVWTTSSENISPAYNLCLAERHVLHVVQELAGIHMPLMLEEHVLHGKGRPSWHVEAS